MSRDKPDVQGRRTVASSRLFEVEELDLEFSNGARTCFERLVSRGHGAVIIAPVQADRTILLIREYAAGTHRYELGLPKGRMEAGEDILAAANREIMEEVGHAGHRLTHLGALTVAPGYMAHQTHLVLAEDLYPETAEGDEPEAIEVVPWSLDRLTELVAREDLTEARSIAALYMVRDYLDG
ncbi:MULTISPECIES: ADP compounds hydrolase NudE [unclassified Thioalkalivibrio]|uniref:ADP compounds hydrolase NudE n=1 Tax=unclassified Thioalkalivibrio TaxID=2621013 RepID=UPI000368998C|nr:MULTISPECIES: ADP compounds hydrolase NudE [unclassified Thioalkalivibrio]